jgi:hypothetical protein
MTPVDRVKAGLLTIIDGATRRIDYLALYPCRVAAQNADGTLELQPDSNSLPSLSKVPVRLGVPGVAVKVAAGSRVLLGFEGGNPQRPAAFLWEFNGSALTEFAIGNSPTSYVALATQTKAALDAIVSTFNAHTHSGVTTGPGASGPPATPISTSTNVASATVKST